MSSELPEKRTLKPLLKKIILWSVIAGGVIALFVPVFVKSTPYISPGYSLTVMASKPAKDPCALFGDDKCIGEGNVRTELSTGDAGRGLENLIFSVVNIFILIAGAVAVFFVVFGGYVILTSSGDQGRQKQGKETVQNALVGLVIVLLAYVIVSVVARFITGLNF